jgi:hypothetical protein
MNFKLEILRLCTEINLFSTSPGIQIAPLIFLPEAKNSLPLRSFEFWA